ncbi:MAG: ATP-dependent helicase HelY [Actinomycetota bacterium]|nr:ATP-dependent helicase HelY [Actinomycetota bacterium]
MTPAEIRAAFTAERPFPLDPFQERALDALDKGRSVLVAAPTGSGKTLVAEYAIACALAQGAKAFYTTPLKALSNQKYGDFVRAYGADRVGLLTGDNAINGDAPIVVMTTEVLRNMIYAGSPTLDGLRYVVLDEVHYLQDPSRGAVWEEVIIHLPPEIDIVALSATVSNAEEVAAWMQTVRGATETVIEERRPVDLVHLYLVGDRSAPALHLLPTFVEDDGDLRPNPVATRLDGRNVPDRSQRRRRLYKPWRTEVVERLAEERMLPAIVFVFSRTGCDQAVEQCLASGIRLTDADERRALRAIAERHVEALSDDDLDVLGYDMWLAGMEAGVAAHHAGLVPPMKEAVEEGFSAGLLKVVFATETLALGINMPARSVVIEKLSKFTGEHHEFLTPGEYTQLAGRAGRRGIDDVGYVVVLWDPFVPFDQVAGLASRRTYALTSSFHPTYNMAANLVQRYPPQQARHLLNLSFAQFHADRDVVAVERDLELRRGQLAEAEAAAVHPAGDVHEYRRLLAELDAARRAARGRSDGRFETLRPGDVVIVPKRGGKVVVLKQERGSGPGRVLALTQGKSLIRLTPHDFRGQLRKVATIDLPRPYAPRSQSFQKAAVETLRRLKVRDAELPADADGDVDDLKAAVAAHPLHDMPGADAALRAAWQADRIARDIARLERRVSSRNESLARQFDRVLGVLRTWGYVEEWNLTDAGHLLTRLNSEGELVIAEAVREGRLDGIDAATMAAVVSCFTFQRRGPDSNDPLPPRRWPNQEVARRSRALEAVWRDLHLAEREARLPETRRPDPGFTAAIYAWVKGEDLADVLEDEEMTGGDFVRNVKQTIDLLRQIADVVTDPATAAVARSAADACLRGVIAASSIVKAPAA